MRGLYFVWVVAVLVVGTSSCGGGIDPSGPGGGSGGSGGGSTSTGGGRGGSLNPCNACSSSQVCVYRGSSSACEAGLATCNGSTTDMCPCYLSSTTGPCSKGATGCSSNVGQYWSVTCQ